MPAKSYPSAPAPSSSTAAPATVPTRLCALSEADKGKTSNEQLIARVEATRFDPANPPPVEPWIFKLADIECLHAGNLAVVVAALKSGKSSTMAAMMSCLIGHADQDYLGFSANPDVTGTVLVFDTEQSRGDHFRLMSSVLRRAGLDKAPSRFASFSLLLESPADRLIAVCHLARKAAAEPAGLAAIFIDGVADLAMDVNALDESTAVVDTLHKLATETRCVIITALHLNPGSEKSRGHLGSQIERKAESVFNLRKEEDIITIVCKPARRQEITADKAPRFKWDHDAGMFMSTASKAASTDDKRRAELSEIADEVFAERPELRWKDLTEAIKSARGGVPSTIEKRIKDMKRLGVIRWAGNGLYMKGGCP